MKKNGFLYIIAFSAAAFAYASIAEAAKIRTFKVPSQLAKEKQEQEEKERRAYARTPKEKIKFRLAKPNKKGKKRRGQTTLIKNASSTYISKGRMISSDEAAQLVDKERFSTATSEEITNDNFPQIVESFDYPNADIIEVTRAISELTGKNFIIDPNVRGKVNIIAPTKITVAEAYKAFLSALSINAVTVVPSGPFLKLRPARNAQRDNIDTYTGEYYPDFDQLATHILPLKYISAQDVKQHLRNLSSKDGSVEPYPPTNSLIITDFGGNINRIVKIIKKIDKPGFEKKMAVIPVKHAAAKDIAKLIIDIITEGKGIQKGRRGSFSSSIPRNRKSGGQGNEVVSIAVPDERTNSIIVLANDAGLKRIRQLVRRLDFKLSADEAGGVHVYYVKYNEAEKIAETLNGLAGDAKKQQQEQNRSSRSGKAAAPTEKTKPLFSGDVKITADKATNALVISAAKNDYATVINLLGKLDIPRDQVYVKSIIMEMNADNQDTFGVSYFKFADGTDGRGRVGFNGGNFNSIANIGTPGAILGFGTGDNVDIAVGTETITVKSLMSFINLLKVHAQGNILSTPSVLALNNEKAIIEVGDEIPVGLTNSQNGTSTQQSVERQKASVKLEVTPFISPDSEMVRMKILQIARAIAQNVVTAAELADISVAIADRTIDTNIVVKSGNTAVMGGLIRTEHQETVRKVPILGDIPILGWLFKSTSKQKRKNNLIVFITPKIMRNTYDIKQVLRAKLDERVDFIQENFNGRDPFGKQMDALVGNSLDSNDIIDETLTGDEVETEDDLDDSISIE